ncbi:MAG: hypothetical protein SAK29_11790 [Scytonema sp. PMC 1069.18]|nr:hypothetical protein [Scytonema sp. PMC 1069.18]MEC4880922.1 hypothetical protein [Scytonema sp. PMC 1070.18]
MTQQRLASPPVCQIFLVLPTFGWNVRLGASRALGKIGVKAKDAVPDLTAVFLDNQEVTWVRYEALQALKNIPSDEATSALIRYESTAKALLRKMAPKLKLMNENCSEVPPKALRALADRRNKQPPAMCQIKFLSTIFKWKCPQPGKSKSNDI